MRRGKSVVYFAKEVPVCVSVCYGEVAFFASLPPLLPPFTLPLLWGGVGEGEPRVLELRLPQPERRFQQLCREPWVRPGFRLQPEWFHAA